MTGIHNASFSPYKDKLIKHTTNEEERDWDDSSESLSVENQTHAPTGALTPLPRTQKLSTNILTSKNGQHKEDVLSVSSLDSSSSDDTNNTAELLPKFTKNKAPLSQKETTPHSLTNKPPSTKKDLTESNQEGDQQTKTTEKELPPPISKDNNIIMSTTNDKNQDAANHSTVTASTTSISTTSCRPSSWQSIMDAANSNLVAQRSYDYLRDGKFWKFPKNNRMERLIGLPQNTEQNIHPLQRNHRTGHDKRE
jgi:hypothetical protein